MATSLAIRSQPRLVIGIPSWNEADTIVQVAKACDAALNACEFSDCIIANADNGSEDGTQDRFMEAGLRSRSVAINAGRQGKGVNVRALAELVVTQNYDGLVLIDADLATVDRSWVDGLVQGLAAGYDAVFARRPPLWNRGDLTYHLCYPALAAIKGIRVREPIAPTQAYSRKVLERAFESDLDEFVEGYGIDFHLATTASDFDWTEIILPVQLEHKLRSFSPEPNVLTRSSKFKDVLSTVRKKGLVGGPLHHAASEQVLQAQSGLVYGVVKLCEEYDLLTAKTEHALTNALAAGRFPDTIAKGVRAALRTPSQYRGLDWDTWRDALLMWIGKDDSAILLIEDVELLLLSRCAGFYHQCLGRRDWYDVVEWQTLDLLRSTLGRTTAPVF